MSIKPELPDWLRLDNAAKIFPPSSRKGDTKVFRVSCELKEDIDEELLNIALSKTIEIFPYFKSTLRRGLFWYYLEKSDIKPIISEEYKPVCSAIYNKKQLNLLFEVTYFHKRINLEIYHVLTDGMGSLEFLKCLVIEYLLLKYPKLKEKNLELKYDATMYEKISDSFLKYYDNKGKTKRNKLKTNYLIKGPIHKECQLEVIEGIISTSKIKVLAKEYDTTITILLTALFLKAIALEMSTRDKRKSVVLSIPVNLRQFFNSQSTRNFFGIMNIDYNFNKQSNELTNIITYVKQFFKEKINISEMSMIINSYMALETNFLARIVPLPLKNLVLKISTNIVDKINTGSLSNLGVVKMPEEVKNYINLFSVTTSTPKIQICLVSYEDNLSISFSSPFINSNIERNFFKMLTERDIDVLVSDNLGGVNNE